MGIFKNYETQKLSRKITKEIDWYTKTQRTVFETKLKILESLLLWECLIYTLL